MGGGSPTPSYIPSSAPAPVAVQAEAVQAKKIESGYQGTNSSLLAASNQGQNVNTGSLGLTDGVKKRKNTLLGG